MTRLLLQRNTIYRIQNIVYFLNVNHGENILLQIKLPLIHGILHLFLFYAVKWRCNFSIVIFVSTCMYLIIVQSDEKGLLDVTYNYSYLRSSSWNLFSCFSLFVWRVLLLVLNAKKKNNSYYTPHFLYWFTNDVNKN